MPGFPENDHRRVCDATVWVERNKDNVPTPPESRSRGRGLVRVMLMEDLGVDLNTPTPIKGDLPYDARTVAAVITEPTTFTFSGAVHYVVRCVSTNTVDVVRTWQLRVISPDGVGTLTAAILEHATADQVRDAINATGCPECEVAGPGRVAMMADGTEVEFPGRQWHIYWPDAEWSLSSMRPVDVGGGETSLEYFTEPNEVAIALIPTGFAPSGVAESVWLPFSRAFAAPTAGLFALCQVLPAFGLVVTEAECVNYVD